MAPARPEAPPPDPTRGRTVLDADAIARVTRRMAHELLEKTAGAGDVVLLGIPTRGPLLATRLAAAVASFEGLQLPVGQLDVTLYRDDLQLRAPRPLMPTAIPSRGIDDAVVVLVDDVLFSGRTIRAALDALRDVGRPRTVQLAVLVDRGHRALPIRADYVGKNMPTSLQEAVAVHLAEHDGADEVVLTVSGPAA